MIQVLTLQDKDPYFEEFGLRMASDICEHSNDDEFLGEARESYLAISGAVLNRSQVLLDLCENSSNEDTSTLLKGLTEREKKTFNVGQGASRSFRLWKERVSGTIVKVQTGKKRPRAAP